MAMRSLTRLVDSIKTSALAAYAMIVGLATDSLPKEVLEQILKSLDEALQKLKAAPAKKSATRSASAPAARKRKRSTVQKVALQKKRKVSARKSS